MTKIIKILHVTVGLPASGKTTWSKRYIKENRGTQHIEIDAVQEIYPTVTIENYLGSPKTYYRDNVILDSLFLNSEDIIKAIGIILDGGSKINNLKIHYWKPNIPFNLWNDKYRRNLDSKITIKNAKISSLEELKVIDEKIPNIKVSFEKHYIIKAKSYKLFANKFNISLNDDDEYIGESWCIGGNFKNCYGTIGVVSSEPQPSGNTVLDGILEELVPNVSYLQHKKIENFCVYYDEFGETDYYGGYVKYNRLIINFKSLYEILNELKLIENLE